MTHNRGRPALTETLTVPLHIWNIYPVFNSVDRQCRPKFISMSYQRYNHYDYQQDVTQELDYPVSSQGRGAPSLRGYIPRQPYNGRNKNPRQRGGSTNSFKKPPLEKVLDEVPKPQHLSKTASVEKNNPLYAESFFTDESQALAPEPDLREIFSGLEVLDIISDTIHNYCVSKSNGFAKRVPQSAFAYYSATYAYARIIDVHQSNFRGLTFDESEFLSKMKEFNSPIPKALSTVLAGLGNTTCPNDRDLKFRMLPREYQDGEYQDVEIPGSFGEASPQTQPLYKSYPCIAVYAQRILADISGDVDWDFPNGIRPADDNALHPNANMLGYKPSVP